MYSASKPQLPEEREDGIVQQPVSQFDHTSAWFSMSNIWRMRAFCLAYPPSREHLAQPVRESSDRVLTQAVAEVPWGHNIALIEKVKDPQQRLWYAAQTIDAKLAYGVTDNLKGRL